MIGYKITTQGPITMADAQKLGRFFGQYAISVSGFKVTEILSDGGKHVNRPLAQTCADVAAVGTVDVAIAPIAVPLLVATGLVLPPISLVGILMAMGLDIKALHWLHKNEVHPKAVYDEITFQFANVSQDRIGWAEYLLALFVARQGWQIEGLRHKKAAAGTRRGASGGSDPIPWASHPRQPPRSRRQRQPRQRQGGLLDSLVDKIMK